MQFGGAVYMQGVGTRSQIARKKALFMTRPRSCTKSGLLAAAHRQGAGMVKRYLDHQRRHNWTTNPKTFPKNKKDQFLSVETRLREFQKVPVWIP